MRNVPKPLIGKRYNLLCRRFTWNVLEQPPSPANATQHERRARTDLLLQAVAWVIEQNKKEFNRG